MSPESEELADRIRTLIGYKVGVTEKKMFGGVCFLLYGNMVVGSMKSGDMLMRVGPERHAEIVARPGYTGMQQGGREMIGFVMAGYDEMADDDALRDAVQFCMEFAKTLPAKPAPLEKPARARPPAKTKAARPAKSRPADF